MRQRLNHALSSCNVGSRRSCDELIRQGKVSVNGNLITTLSTYVDLDNDQISVSGHLVSLPQKIIYAYHKPKGVVCTNDPYYLGKKVIDYFPQHLRLFTVGRLDKESSGLLLVTNDGQFAHHIMHPSFGISKEYVVKTRQEITEHHLQLLRKGVVIDRHRILPKKVTKVRKGTVKIVVSEGKKHEVRILVEQAQLELLELHRIRIGPFILHQLPPGSFRSITPKERTLFFSSMKSDDRLED